MSGTTIRKLRQISEGGRDLGYFLPPPRNWLETVEKTEGKKILHFTFKSQDEGLVLNPAFEESTVYSSRNSSDDVRQLLKKGNLKVALREIRKGRNVYRVVKVPRVWIRSQELQRYRKVVALSVTPESEYLVVKPVFGNKIKQV